MYKLKSDIVNTIVVVSIAFSTCACSNTVATKNASVISITSELEKQPLPELLLENGEKVSDCSRYTAIRENVRISEMYHAQQTARLYLSCSLALISEHGSEHTAHVLSTLLLSLKTKQLPFSINPQFEGSVSLESAGFTYESDNALVFEDEYSRISIEYKGAIQSIGEDHLLKNHKSASHLLWIEDTAKKGNYVAYYPVLLTLFNAEHITNTSKNRISVSPLYKSGY